MFAFEYADEKRARWWKTLILLETIFFLKKQRAKFLLLHTFAYHRHTFCTQILLGRNLEEWKPFCVSKNFLSTSIFPNLPKLKFFWIFAKRIHNHGGKDVSKQFCHLIRILKEIGHLYRFWKKSISIFCKTDNIVHITPILYVLEKSYNFCHILLQICESLVAKTSPIQNRAPALSVWFCSTLKDIFSEYWLKLLWCLPLQITRKFETQIPKALHLTDGNSDRTWIMGFMYASVLVSRKSLEPSLVKGLS